jgi:hypothetical protein
VLGNTVHEGEPKSGSLRKRTVHTEVEFKKNNPEVSGSTGILESSGTHE